MKFKYKVKTKNGEIQEGITESSDKFSLAREFKEKGDIPFSIKEVIDKKNLLSFNISIPFLSGVSLSEKIMFTRNLSGMISAGISLPRAISIMGKQSKNKELEKILESLIDDIDRGGTLSDGMRKFPKVFSELFVSMVRAGEESGGLPKALNDVGENLQKTFALRKKIKGAMMYPSIILSAMVLIGVLMLIYVVPTLTKTFTDVGAALPASTRFVIWLSDSIKNHIFLFIIFVFAIIGFFMLIVRIPKTKRYFDFISIRLPLVGVLVREINSARTTRTLSSLLSAGIDISKALNITKAVLQNSYYKDVINESIISIEKGLTLSSVFKEHSNLYPIMVGEMMEVGEETGKLSSMLVDIATFYEGEVEAKTKNLSTVIEPILMVVIGSAVGFFAVSMLQPMYSVMENIK